jgi:hypothetical protein
MSDDVVELDVFLVTLLIPESLAPTDVEKIRETINRPAFAEQLRDAALRTLRSFRALAPVTITITR